MTFKVHIYVLEHYFLQRERSPATKIILEHNHVFTLIIKPRTDLKHRFAQDILIYKSPSPETLKFLCLSMHIFRLMVTTIFIQCTHNNKYNINKLLIFQKINVFKLSDNLIKRKTTKKKSDESMSMPSYGFFTCI